MAEADAAPSLIDGCRRGDPAAQRQLFDQYRDRVYSIALQYLRGDRQAAQDATQEAFIRVFRSLVSFRADAQLSSWLYRIVANVCIDELRRRRRYVLFGDLPPMLDSTVPPAEPADGDADLRAAIQALPRALRMTVLLRYYDDLSYGEIAAALGCSAGTVASRLHRAHAALADRLGAHDVEERA